ncbi:MAG TPA: helix-turn-helix domain-containing protein [Vicinamibacterales bacterium]|nr:helix-turn-helix domain-containing protein [Vicinamibacterales bacterium]
MRNRSELNGAAVLTPPHLLTPGEVAELLRTSRKAIYAMVERGQLPGVVRIGRRVLIRDDLLLEWLRQKTTPSLERQTQ